MSVPVAVVQALRFIGQEYTRENNRPSPTFFSKSKVVMYDCAAKLLQLKDAVDEADILCLIDEVLTVFPSDAPLYGSVVKQMLLLKSIADCYAAEGADAFAKFNRLPAEVELKERVAFSPVENGLQLEKLRVIAAVRLARLRCKRASEDESRALDVLEL